MGWFFEIGRVLFPVRGCNDRLVEAERALAMSVVPREGLRQQEGEIRAS